VLLQETNARSRCGKMETAQILRVFHAESNCEERHHTARWSINGIVQQNAGGPSIAIVPINRPPKVASQERCPAQ
jgi:hypothetical protein